MSLTLKITAQAANAGTQVLIKDVTGAYASPGNVGGWGSPNPELSQTALLVYSILKTPDTTILLAPPVTPPVLFNPANVDSTSQSMLLSYAGDGHTQTYVFAIPYSANGTVTAAGHTLIVGDYYYGPPIGGGANNIYLVTARGGSPTQSLVTDYSTLIGVGAVAQVVNDSIFFNQLTIKKELQYYRDYRAARNADDLENMDYLLKVIKDLEVDIDGAYWQFNAGLFTQAEDIVAELVERHGIINGNIIPLM